MADIDNDIKELLESEKMRKPNQRGGRPKKYENGWDSVKSDYMRKYAKEKLIGSFFVQFVIWNFYIKQVLIAT
jgi:hypothetical protein